MEQYFESQRDHIFQNVGVLIFVFDVTSKEFHVDLEHYMNCLNALSDLSQNAKIFVLIHKMDLIREDMRDDMFNEKMTRIMEATSNNFKDKTQCFRTSIWDETLYKAWSTIVSILLPNINQLKLSLQRFCSTIRANEVVLFEKSTFLMISHFDAANHEDDHRFEKISNIIKQFKLSCIKTNYQF